jgi:transcriptional regulator with XRE-family HTH domain
VPNRSKREQSPHRDAAAELGRRLRAARDVKRLSQQQLAELASVAIGTVRALERGRSVDPSFFTVLALAQALDLDAATLIAVVSDVSSPVSSTAPASAAASSTASESD